MAVQTITLTEAAKTYLEKNHSEFSAKVIPHGYATSPDLDLPKRRVRQNSVPEILMFGALRPNRDMATTMINLVFANLGCKVSLVTRPFSHQQLNDSAVLRTMLATASQCPNVSVELTLPMTDDEVNYRLCQADILALPYMFGGHSGQIEHAFDCGVLPLITDVGFTRSQSNFWPDVQETGPVVANWSDGKSWLYQPRFIQSAREAITRLSDFRGSLNMTARKMYRAAEHERVLTSHHEVYVRAIQQAGKE